LRHRFWLIAGPDGVCKTTYAVRHLRAVLGTVHLLSLDEIARGLSPLEPCGADPRARADAPAGDLRHEDHARRAHAPRPRGGGALGGAGVRLLDNGGPRPVGVAEGVGRRAEFVDEERLATLPADLGAVRDWRPLSP
jgi:hypothetical protein